MCPYCDGMVSFTETPKLGDKVTCPYCGEKLEVVNLDPLKLEYEYADDFQYADDYEYDDDYDM